MQTLLIIASFISVATAGDQNQPEDKCKGELKRCLENQQFDGRSGLPLTHEHIKTLCRTYQGGMDCVQSWNKECLPLNTRLVAERQMASAQLFMGLLCNDEGFQKEYLNHTDCFAGVSQDWTRCNNVFQAATKEIKAKAYSQPYTQNTIDTCCAKYGFNRCISQASKAKCDRSGAVLLRRISETLSHNVKCDGFNTGLCSSAGSINPLILLIMLPLLAMLLLFRTHCDNL